MAELKDFSTTAASNNGAPPHGWPEGMNPSDVNNTARELYAVLARYQSDREAPITTGGTSTAYTLTPSGTYSAYSTRMAFLVKFHVATGASPTINVSALGAKALKWPNGTALAANDLAINTVVLVAYDGTDFLVLTVDGPPSFKTAGAGLTATGSSVALDVNDLTAETAPAVDDHVPIYDTSAAATDKMRLDDLLKTVNVLTEDTAPDPMADFLLTYDASAAAPKKILGHRFGKLIQRVVTEYTTHGSTAATTPNDDTIPQNTEGAEFFTRAVTPKATTNRLLITVVVQLYNNGGWVVHVHQDTTADALVAQSGISSTANQMNVVTLVHEMAAGTTSSTTFKVRAGAQGSTTYLNGNSGGRLMGGVSKCYIVVEEYLA